MNFLPLEGNPSYIKTEELYFNANRSTPHFLYLFTRDFHSVVFTYASAIRSVAVFDLKRYPHAHDLDLITTLKTLCKDTCALRIEENYDIEYSIQTDGCFYVYPTDAAKYDPNETFRETLFSLFLASKYIANYPASRSNTLCAFLTVVKERYADELKAFDGFKVPAFDKILHTAMSNYAVYYQMANVAAITRGAIVTEAEFLEELSRRCDLIDKATTVFGNTHTPSWLKNGKTRKNIPSKKRNTRRNVRLGEIRLDF